MRLILLLFSLFIIVSCQETTVKVVSMKGDVYFLAKDSLKGRATGTDGEKAAANYLESRFKDLGLQPMGSDGFFQEFQFKPSTNPHKQAVIAEVKDDSLDTGMNVIGFLDNNQPNTIIIGAHFDHLGYGGEGSLHRGDAEIHNGADDNASGVAMMLKLANSLKNASKNSNYLFIAFSGEELGLLGSNYFVKNPTIDLSTVSYMINLDMVGRLNEENTIAVHGVGTSPIFKQTLFANNDGSLIIAEKESGIGPSDFTSFYLADISVLAFFTGQHEDYHKPGDDADKINYEGMETIANYILRIISDLDDEGQLVFKKTKNESEDVPNFKVALGVVPDYLFTGKGMRIDGISEDRPAQNAGMEKGDIVVRLGDNSVTDMMTYMKALAKYEKGDNAKVLIDRNGEIIEFEVTF
jgi:hypothetical protein